MKTDIKLKRNNTSRKEAQKVAKRGRKPSYETIIKPQLQMIAELVKKVFL